MARRIVWLLIAIAVARIVSTYWILNHTMDEPSFISAGFEWLDSHMYAYMPEQPPLSHVTAAIGAKLAGATLQASRYDAHTRWPMGFDPHGQGALLLPKLCGSESNAEVCGDLLPRGEFTGWQF